MKIISNLKLQIANSKILLFCLLVTVHCLLPTVSFAEMSSQKSLSGTSEFTLTVTDSKIELNGTEFMVWKYNDMFPGPEIRVKEGDVIKVKLINKSSAKHGLFFHGLYVNSRVSRQEQEIFVDPEYEYTYGEFIAKPAGTHLYHCSLNMGEHLSRGMYGAFIVEAKDEPKYDKEFVYILSDWNSKAAKGESQHELGHPRTMMENDITTINDTVVTGENPIIMDVKQGEKIRIRLANIGMLPHTLKFAESFLLTHEDGYRISEPKNQDTLTIHSGKRYDVTITAKKVGRFLFYHSIDMPPGAAEKLTELESSEKKAGGSPTESIGGGHKHDYSSAPSDAGEVSSDKDISVRPRTETKKIIDKNVINELPILALDVNPGTKGFGVGVKGGKQ